MVYALGTYSYDGYDFHVTKYCGKIWVTVFLGSIKRTEEQRKTLPSDADIKSLLSTVGWRERIATK